MSGFHTHALIGAVGGLGLARLIAATRPELLPERVLGLAAPSAWPISAGGVAVILASALLALIPDIDEPHSFVAQRVREVLTATGMALGAVLGMVAGGPAWLPLAGGVAGVLLGLLAGWALLRGIRAAAGGHRHLTHSLVFAGALLALGGLLWTASAPTLALAPAAIAWGVLLHDLADVVTPSGVPLLYPLSERRVRVLPAALAPFGEPLIAAAAMCAAWAMISI
ncbi:metal-dependent hydrolase [Oscillochloris sp. ZM17-4]|uniref:metal-dependent hydrolase n=1 Tax=Oscillochloris sp. ZM17-4 TaxID=2866714 RepID=UPI001C735B3D|nr:metal-dependent hydrolase [Oscillochloris sp. ZM17-4]